MTHNDLHIVITKTCPASVYVPNTISKENKCLKRSLCNYSTYVRGLALWKPTRLSINETLAHIVHLVLYKFKTAELGLIGDSEVWRRRRWRRYAGASGLEMMRLSKLRAVFRDEINVLK